jgi:hypothetical protein
VAQAVLAALTVMLVDQVTLVQLETLVAAAIIPEAPLVLVALVVQAAVRPVNTFAV